MKEKPSNNNENFYKKIRKNHKISREKITDLTDGALTSDRLRNIEEGISVMNPIDVILMEKAYNETGLCDHYCAHDCEIGKIHVKKVINTHDLSQTTLALLSCLNQIEQDKNSIINMASDGKISDDELNDFELFRDHLNKMELAIAALQKWAEKHLNNHSQT